MNFKALTIATALAAASIGAFAQTNTPRIDQREANQQQRIANGAASGELNARETNRLEKEQAHIDKAEAKAKSDGKVTKKERAHIEKMQDKASHDIHHQKHDAQTAR